MSGAAPLVSVVVVVERDAGGQLRDALASVARQHVDGRVEVIVVDDAARPAVGLTMREQARGVRMVRQPHRMGASAARNRGLSLATGRYVAFLDATERWDDQLLSVMLRAMQNEQRAWSFCDAELLIAGRRYRAPGPLGDPLGEVAVLSSSALVAERQLLWASGGFSASSVVLAAWELSIRLARVARPAVVEQALVVTTLARRGRGPLRVLDERRELSRKYGADRRLGGPRFAFLVAGVAPAWQRPFWRRVAARG